MEETNMSKTKSVPCARNENESEHNYHRMDDDSMVNEIETVQPTQSKTINEEDVGIILDAKKSEFNKTQLLEKDLVRKAGHLDWDCNQPIALNFSLVPRSNDTISKVDVPIEKLSVGVNCDNEYNQMGEIDVGVHGNFSWNNDYNYMNYIETEVEVETTNTTEEIEANEHGYYIDNKINSSNENVKENQVKVRNGSSGCSFGFNDGNVNCEIIGKYEILIGCGMVNLGNSCFFNACLQAFFHIPTINNHLQKIKGVKCKCVICTMINTFKDTHANKNGMPYNASKLYQVMRPENNDLLNGEQQDAKQFWMRIMEVIQNDKNSSDMFLFEHDITTILKCEYCESTSETNAKTTGHVIDVHGRHSIQQALDAYFTEEVVETYICEVCETINQWKAKKKYLMKSTPKILCLILNRLAKNGRKYNHNIGLNYQLQLADLHLSNKSSHIIYKLVSTINHIGTNISEGHCTATACCSSRLFYEFNDSLVHCVNTISGTDAYILIYELSAKVQLSDKETIEINDACNQTNYRETIREIEYDYEMTGLSNESQEINKVACQQSHDRQMADLSNESQDFNGGDCVLSNDYEMTDLSNETQHVNEGDCQKSNDRQMTDLSNECQHVNGGDYVLLNDYEMADLSNETQHVNEGDSQKSNDRQMADLSNERQYVNGADREPSNIQDKNNSGMRLQQVQDEFDFPDGANIQCSDNIRISGRRIVDFAFLYEQLRNLNRHEFECEDSRILLIKETKLGLRSIIHYECSSCGKKYQIKSCFKLDDMINVNKVGALGITSIGSGFYHIEELCAHLDIPCMSSSTFDRENKKLQKDWGSLAKNHSEQALQEEIELAFARGDVDSAGNALIPAVCDGSWGKRSYGKGFSSLSGSAAIIGVYTKKVIYFDTKNKYCDVCTKSYAMNCPPNDHQCNINYNGPSSGMETEIIVEGFKYCEKKGARFHKIIMDGDSSVFKEIREQRIYQNPELVVEKIECVNRLFKNFHKKFTKLCNNSKFKIAYRKLIKPSIGEEISKGIRMAAIHWSTSNVSIIEKLQNLEKDCLNAPYHYLGDHSSCSQYFCNKKTTEESIRIINLLKSGHVFQEILNYCNIYFASNVRSLIKDQSNNSAEELNNIIAKYLGGKRINYSLAGSYTARVSAAVVQYNTKGHAGSTFHEFINTGNNACLKMENSRKNHYIKNEIARQIKPRKRMKTDNKNSITGYADPQTPDMDGNAFEVAKTIAIDKLDTDQANRDMILRKTYGQKYNLEWFDACKKLVNCSYFGRIINSRSPKTYTKWLGEILYSKSECSNTADLCHQRIYETEALRVFSLVHHKYDLEQTGLWIDREFSFLGASPLRLYGPERIVSVFCPIKAFHKTIDEAIAKKVLPCLKMKDGKFEINEKSNWYIEVQGQLHITERKIAYMVLWLGTEFTIFRVAVNQSFWNNQMKEKLKFFFNECMIKELANPRKFRKMDLRRYNPLSKTFV